MIEILPVLENNIAKAIVRSVPAETWVRTDTYEDAFTEDMTQFVGKELDVVSMGEGWYRYREPNDTFGYAFHKSWLSFVSNSKLANENITKAMGYIDELLGNEQTNSARELIGPQGMLRFVLAVLDGLRGSDVGI